MQPKGFTLVDTMVTVAIVCVLAALATPAYHNHIVKTQASEATAMMDAEKSKVLVNLTKKSSCSNDGASYSVEGKYGTLAVTGTLSVDALSYPNTLLKTGCNLKYTFANSGISKRLQGKVISADLFNNNVLSKSTATNVDSQYLAKSFTSLTEDSKPAKAPVVSESAYVAKDTVAIVELPESTTVTGTDITKRPNGVACNTPYEYNKDETPVFITTVGNYKAETEYYIRGSSNLYNMFVADKGRAPNPGEKIRFISTCAVAFVGDSVTTPALTVGNFPASTKLIFTNFGVIVGRGADGISPGCSRIVGSCRFVKNKPAGGTAVQGSSSVNLTIENYGVVAGGGGGGGYGRGSQLAGGGGGAPYGKLGKSYYKRMGADGTFTEGGMGNYAGKDFNGGKGGGWGERGEDKAYDGTPAGKIYTGNVTIIKKGSGWTKGN